MSDDMELEQTSAMNFSHQNDFSTINGGQLEGQLLRKIDAASREMKVLRTKYKVMSDEHRDILIDKYQELVSNMIPDDVINILFSKKVFTAHDVERIKHTMVPNEQNSILLDLLMRRRDDDFYVFANALAKTGQQHLASEIIQNEKENEKVYRNQLSIERPYSMINTDDFEINLKQKLKQHYIQEYNIITPLDWSYDHMTYIGIDTQSILVPPFLKKTNLNIFYGEQEEIVGVASLFKSHGQGIPRKTVVEGKPGIGKSSLVKHIIAREWAIEQEKKEQQFSIPFRIVFLLEGNQIKSNISDQILNTYLPEHFLKNNSDWSDWLQEFMEEKQNEILLIIDGLEECTFDSTYDLKNFMMKAPKYLPGLNVILTSRPGYAASLLGQHAAALIDRKYELAGFNKEQQIQYIKRFMKITTGSKKDLQSLLDDLEYDRDPYLSDVCTNPLILFILCCLYSGISGQHPSTKTKLYELIIDTLFEKDEKRWEKKEKLKVGELQSIKQELQQIAWDGIMYDTSYANTDNGSKSTSSGFLSKQMIGGLRPRYKHCFNHKTFQNFFAAASFVDFTIQAFTDVVKSLKIFRNVTAEDAQCQNYIKYEMMLVFLCGLLRKADPAKKLEVLFQLLQERVKPSNPAMYGQFLSLCMKCIHEYEGKVPEEVAEAILKVKPLNKIEGSLVSSYKLLERYVTNRGQLHHLYHMFKNGNHPCLNQIAETIDALEIIHHKEDERNDGHTKPTPTFSLLVGGITSSQFEKCPVVWMQYTGSAHILHVNLSGDGIVLRDFQGHTVAMSEAFGNDIYSMAHCTGGVTVAHRSGAIRILDENLETVEIIPPNHLLDAVNADGKDIFLYRNRLSKIKSDGSMVIEKVGNAVSLTNPIKLQRELKVTQEVPTTDSLWDVALTSDGRMVLTYRHRGGFSVFKNKDIIADVPDVAQGQKNLLVHISEDDQVWLLPKHGRSVYIYTLTGDSVQQLDVTLPLGSQDYDEAWKYNAGFSVSHDKKLMSVAYEVSNSNHYILTVYSI